jgi:hypothetical protein
MKEQNFLAARFVPNIRQRVAEKGCGGIARGGGIGPKITTC